MYSEDSIQEDRTLSLAILLVFEIFQKTYAPILTCIAQDSTRILDFVSAEQQWRDEPRDDNTPERIYERAWAIQVFENVLLQLRREYANNGRAYLFDAFKPHLIGESDAARYAELASALNISEGAAKTAVHRMRKRYQTLLRSVVADTVDDGQTVDEELRDLFEALT